MKCSLFASFRVGVVYSCEHKHGAAYVQPAARVPVGLAPAMLCLAWLEECRELCLLVLEIGLINHQGEKRPTFRTVGWPVGRWGQDPGARAAVLVPAYFSLVSGH